MRSLAEDRKRGQLLRSLSPASEGYTLGEKL